MKQNQRNKSQQLKRKQNKPVQEDTPQTTDLNTQCLPMKLNQKNQKGTKRQQELQAKPKAEEQTETTT